MGILKAAGWGFGALLVVSMLAGGGDDTENQQQSSSKVASVGDETEKQQQSSVEMEQDTASPEQSINGGAAKSIEKQMSLNREKGQEFLDKWDSIGKDMVQRLGRLHNWSDERVLGKTTLCFSALAKNIPTKNFTKMENHPDYPRMLAFTFAVRQFVEPAQYGMTETRRNRVIGLARYAAQTTDYDDVADCREVADVVLELAEVELE